jgi:anhydro-N-acetylmuramic acid kinase
MTLHKIVQKKNLVIIGLNSGTSADGLDMAVVRFKKGVAGPTIKFIEGKTVAYPKSLQIKINNALSRSETSIDKIIELDRQLGHFYGEQAAKFGDNLKRKGSNPDLIASHGQTILHLPGKIKVGRKTESGTVQLGHPETIACLTGRVTVADFRQADIAAGGEGAPITSKAMYYLMGDSKKNRLVINIGGIANYFLFPKKDSIKNMLARDCGPGNSLMDILTEKYFGKKYDNGGRLASKGKISKRLLSVLLADNYLKGKYGPSTGRERFGVRFAEKIMHASERLSLRNYDALATTTELTAVSIGIAIKPLLPKYKINEVYLFGGGVKNKYLLERLRANLPEIKLFSVDRLRLNPDYLEAACYAVMGGMAIDSKAAGVPHVTGASGATVAGRIVQPMGA